MKKKYLFIAILTLAVSLSACKKSKDSAAADAGDFSRSDSEDYNAAEEGDLTFFDTDENEGASYSGGSNGGIDDENNGGGTAGDSSGSGDNSGSPGEAAGNTDDTAYSDNYTEDFSMELKPEWCADQDFVLSDPVPWNLKELKQCVDVTDPRSVAAYWVAAVTRLVDNYDDGMEMMKYLFADLEPFGRGYTEGGLSGRAGWDTYFNERLKSLDYSWLPRCYFEGAEANNGFKPSRPYTIELYYNSTNTETANDQSLEQLGRLNIVYWVKSHAAGNKVNITLSKFDGSGRFYVTNGASSAALFYDQRSALTQKAKELLKTTPNDDSTAAEHENRYK